VYTGSHAHCIIACTGGPSLAANEQVERAAVESEVQRQLATLQKQAAIAAAAEQAGSSDGTAATTAPGTLCMQSLLSNSHT
jgi:hypothetical protein